VYDNLEVFITTCNRAEMFKETLVSICDQSAKGFDIIIVDNASSDNTKEVVEEIKKQYPTRNIIFKSFEENIGGTNNLNRARLMAKKEWAMLFHDDDLMHPEYIKNAMDLLRQNPDAVMASCTYTALENPDSTNWEKFSKNAGTGVYIADVKGFAAVMFGLVTHNFASTIYKSEQLKNHEFKSDIYGKMWDRPFMLDIASHGKTIILKDPYIRYRLHPGQDTGTTETGPYAVEWFALMNCYKGILGDGWVDKYGIIYNSFVHSQLRLGYHWMQSVKSKMKFKEFKIKAAESGVIRKFEVFKIFELISNFTSSVCKKNLYS